MLLLQVTLVARDGTPFIFANAHIKDGNKEDKAQNIRTRIPHPKEVFKIQAIRNMLLQLTNMPPPAVSQGSSKTPVVVLAGDFNSLPEVVGEAVRTMIIAPESKHDQVSYVGIDPRHLQLLRGGHPRLVDYIFSTSLVEGLVEEHPILNEDGLHIALLAHIASRARPPHQPRLMWQRLKNNIEAFKQDMLERLLALQEQGDVCLPWSCHDLATCLHMFLPCCRRHLF